MWVITSFGILMPAAVSPEDDPEGGLLQIRARDRRALAELANQLPDLGPIHATPDRDYQFRAYVLRESFGAWLGQAAATIDYEKFKPTTARYRRTNRQLHLLYLDIWGLVEHAYHARPRRRAAQPTRRAA